VFTVGIDVTMNESMEHCDIVLPAATHFEYADIYASYGHHWLQRAEPVIPPQGDSLPNTEIFRRLAARFGFNDPCFGATDEQLIDEAVDLADGTRPSEIATDGAVQMKGPDGNPLVMFDNVFPATPSGKIELRSESLAKRWGDAVLMPTWREHRGDYPLMLISPASNTRISSTLGFTGSPPKLLMHPHDAASRGLTHGGNVKVWNGRGEVILPLDITDDVAPGVVASEKGAWLSTSRTGQTISALVSADMRADLAEGACFNDTLVEVAPA
jgi:anaerobic selenocysteine-containing dehydrogenase